MTHQYLFDAGMSIATVLMIRAIVAFMSKAPQPHHAFAVVFWSHAAVVVALATALITKITR